MSGPFVSLNPFNRFKPRPFAMIRFPRRVSFLLISAFSLAGAATLPAARQTAARSGATPAVKQFPAETAGEEEPPPSKPLKTEDIAKVLEQLTEIQETLNGKRSSYNATVLARLKEASASPDRAFNLWLDAVKQVEYEEQGKSASEFSDFRNGRGKELRTNGDFTAQIRLQVKFLALVVMTAEARTAAARAEVVTQAAAYLEEFIACAKKLNGRCPELNRSVLDTPIAKFLKLDVTLQKTDRLALNPGNLSDIYEKLILPPARERRAAAAISAAWQKRISQELALVEAERVPEKTEAFRREREPALKWRMARDLFKAGEHAPATASMLALIKGNLGHKDAPAWIAELTETLRARAEKEQEELRVRREEDEEAAAAEIFSGLDTEVKPAPKAPAGRDRSGRGL